MAWGATSWHAAKSQLTFCKKPSKSLNTFKHLANLAWCANKRLCSISLPTRKPPFCTTECFLQRSPSFCLWCSAPNSSGFLLLGRVPELTSLCLMVFLPFPLHYLASSLNLYHIDFLPLPAALFKREWAKVQVQLYAGREEYSKLQTVGKRIDLYTGVGIYKETYIYKSNQFT